MQCIYIVTSLYQPNSSTSLAIIPLFSSICTVGTGTGIRRRASKHMGCRSRGRRQQRGYSLGSRNRRTVLLGNWRSRRQVREPRSRREHSVRMLRILGRIGVLARVLARGQPNTLPPGLVPIPKKVNVFVIFGDG